MALISGRVHLGEDCSSKVLSQPNSSAGHFQRSRQRAAMTTPAASWIEFPKLSPAKEKLMMTVATTLDKELGELLNPSLTPQDVRAFQSQDGNSQGSVVIRSGKPGSKIHFLLGSWLHSNLPFGPLNITTLQTVLGPEIDSPHFLLELIQMGHKSLVLCLDNIPRKDLIVYPEYLKRFYENTKLDEQRIKLLRSQCENYISPSLFVRALASPTAVLLKFTTENDEELDQLVSESIGPCVEETVSVWLHGFKDLGNTSESEAETSLMRKRDEHIRENSVEVDLRENLPRLFGQEIAERVISAVIRAE